MSKSYVGKKQRHKANKLTATATNKEQEEFIEHNRAGRRKRLAQSKKRAKKY